MIKETCAAYDTSDGDKGRGQVSICKERHKVTLLKAPRTWPHGGGHFTLICPPAFPLCPSPSSLSHSHPPFILPLPPTPSGKGVMTNVAGRTMLLVTAVITTAAWFHLRHTRVHMETHYNVRKILKLNTPLRLQSSLGSVRRCV